MDNNNMASCNFLLDVVVTQLKVYDFKIEDTSKLKVDIRFNKYLVHISASRINVAEFQPGRTTEFQAIPEKLRETLEKFGMPVAVIYGGKLLGTGHIVFPPQVIDSISEGMNDVIQVANCSFKYDGKVVGQVEILYRLFIKCNEEEKAENDTRPSMDNNINPRDIMFVMSESQQCPTLCDPCLESVKSEEGDDRLYLDLQRYKNLNSKVTVPMALQSNNSAGNSACNELKRMVRECTQLIDTATKHVGQSHPVSQPCDESEDLKSSGAEPCPEPYPGCLSKFQYKFEPLSNNSIRFCPVCLTSISWLPKFAACPKCGAKPMPIIEEVDNKQKKQTVEDILKEYISKPQGAKDSCSGDSRKQVDERRASKEQYTACRCTCKFGKLCARCRIHKLCADIFQSDEIKVTKEEEESECSVDHCVIKKSQDSRPFLSRVFSELRDLYDIKDAKRPSELDKRCGVNVSEKRVSPTQNMDDRKELNTIEQNNSPDLKGIQLALNTCKPKKYSVRVGHKFCKNQKNIISRHHGWAWSSSKEARKYGWRPGAILKPIKRIMNFFLRHEPETNAFKECMKEEMRLKEKENQMPTLNVCKRNGEIFITLRALNNPNVEMKPIKFKVVKSDLAKALREIKRNLKDKGFRKCICHKSLMLCVCRNHMEKRQLEKALRRECRKRRMETCVDQLVLTDTSESDIEYDFDVTPPAGINKPQRLSKPPVISHSTQTARKDKFVAPVYPIMQSPYRRAYDCAVRDRYTGAAFGAPGQTIIEDGVFGHRGGGIHGASAAPGGIPKNNRVWGARTGGPMRNCGGLGKTAIQGAKKAPSEGRGKPIPVKMTDRYEKNIENAAKAKEEAKKGEEMKRKKGIDMMKYLQKSGAIGKNKIQPIIGPDGLTDAQRRRRALFRVPMPPVETITRRGKGFHPCSDQCYNQSDPQYFNPCYEFC